MREELAAGKKSGLITIRLYMGPEVKRLPSVQWRNLGPRYPRVEGVGGAISAKICVFIRGFRQKIDKM